MHIYLGIESPNDDAGERSISFRIGSRVRVHYDNSDDNYSYGGVYVGCEGEIVRIPEISMSTDEEPPKITIGVVLDGKYNERSRYGCYWFRPDELSVITENTKENTNMLLLKGYKIARVGIGNLGNQYVAYYDETLEDGDRVVVAADDGYHLGRVFDVLSDGPCVSCKPKFQIVCKIDDSAFCERIDRAKRARDLERKLKTAVADYQQIALYEMLAEKSPEIAALLSELKEVTNA